MKAENGNSNGMRRRKIEMERGKLKLKAVILICGKSMSTNSHYWN
ncbi:22429_t:CDS:2 [Gigaspora margarita]|uniref:22429_t:CDS:1 n=1 Tax=Gigaspora margarita TaxID=4874 RepID=A0ABN7UTV5_GIGMA|nr:22429_t:CDS:2 [Gigaspora margarita]